jgi:hypothetical protein
MKCQRLGQIKSDRCEDVGENPASFLCAEYQKNLLKPDFCR